MLTTLERHQQPHPMSRYPEGARLVEEAIKRHANGNLSALARMIGRSHSLLSQMRQGGNRGSRDTIEALAGLPGEDLKVWLDAFGYGSRTPEDERTLIATLAADAAIRRLLEEVRILTPSDRILDWLKSVQERYGRQVAIHFSGGAASLTHQQVDDLIAYHEARIKREGWEPIGQPDEPELTERRKGD